jgi:hypothetical protein
MRALIRWGFAGRATPKYNNATRSTQAPPPRLAGIFSVSTFFCVPCGALFETLPHFANFCAFSRFLKRVLCGQENIR